METIRLARHVFYVDAIQVTEENMPAVAEWCGGRIQATDPKNGLRRYIKVDVPRAHHENQTKAFVGDWVLSNGMGFKVYKDGPLFKDFHRVDEEPCGLTQWTADHKPCVLGKFHRDQVALIGCRSLTDYQVVNEHYKEKLNVMAENYKSFGGPHPETAGYREMFDHTGGVQTPFTALDADMGPGMTESCA